MNEPTPFRGWPIYSKSDREQRRERDPELDADEPDADAQYHLDRAEDAYYRYNLGWGGDAA